MNYDIVIIGAGASGLMAAHLLTRAGYKIAVVEARARPGGRIQTEHEPVRCETGAEFIHGHAPTTMRMLRESGNGFAKVEGNFYSVYKGQVEDDDGFDSSAQQFFEVLKSLKDDTAVADILERNFAKNERLRESITRFVEGFDAADIRQMSAFALREEWEHADQEQQYRVHNTYEVLIDYLHNSALASGCTFFLSTIVTRIKWAPQCVAVYAGDMCVRGSMVVVSVPLSILQRHMIDFEPPAPVHLQAAQRIGYGGVIKFHLLFRSRIWETCPRKFTAAQFIFSDAPIPTWWTQYPDETPLLTGWLGGPPAKSVSHQEQMLFSLALDSLCYLLQTPAEDLKREIEHFRITDWTKDELTMGAYSFSTPESVSARNVLNTPVDNTIFFCGEALAENGAGTVEAALQTGEATARKIMKLKTAATTT